MTRAAPRIALWGGALLVVSAMPFAGLSSRWTQLIALIGVNVLLAQSMNIVGGYASQVSLGQAGVFAAGAYGSAVLSTKLHWPIWLSIPAGTVIAMCVGLVIALPAERVREFYLGMVTLAFGIIAFEVLQYWTPVTGGSMGLSNIPSPVLGSLSVAGFAINLKLYCTLIVWVVAVMTLLQANLVQSRMGRAFVAAGESEVAAASLGIRPGRTKHLAYVMSAMWAGLAGALYAHLTAYISPESFNLWMSVSILVMAIFGGLRTFIGPFLGAAFFTLLPEFTQVFKDYQLLVYGLILLVSYMAMPQGLAGLLTTRTPFVRQRKAALVGEGDDAVEAPAGSRAPAAHALEIRDVVKRFGGIVALDGVSFKVSAGTIHGLIGPNGSGKSTLVNVVTGIYEPSSGEVLCEGAGVSGLPSYRFVQLGLARTFQNPLMFSGMTVRESVMTGAHSRFRSSLAGCLADSRRNAGEEAKFAAEADAIIDSVGLTSYRDASASALPYGRKRMLDLARALATRPRTLILDEPAAGLSELELDQLAAVLRRLHSAGVTILLIEHHLDFLFNLVQSVTVLDHGLVIFDGPPAKARADDRVAEAYLGSYGRA